MNISKVEKLQKNNKKLLFYSIFLMFFMIFSSFLLISCDKNVPPEEISLSLTEVSLFKGQTQKLYIDVYPKEAKNFTLEMTSTDSKTVSIDKRGYIQGHKYGEAIITISIKGSDISAQCHVVVGDGKIVNVSVKDNTFYYFEGQTFDENSLKVYAVYESGKEVLLKKEEYTIEAPQTLSLDSEIKIKYGNFKEKIYSPIILEDYVKSIEVVKQPNKTEYVIGEEFDKSGLTIQKVYASGKTEEFSDFQVDTTKVGYKQNQVKISYDKFETTIPITTKAQITVQSISQLQKAINDGYKSIMLEEASYNTSTQIILNSVQDLIIFGETADTSINGWNNIPFTFVGNCQNVILADFTITRTGETPSEYQIDFSNCTGGNITLSNLNFLKILQPEFINYTLKIENI